MHTRARGVVIALGVSVAIALCQSRPGAAPADPPVWGPLRSDDCVGDGVRQVSAELLNLEAVADWDAACHATVRNVMGVAARKPDRCVRRKTLGLIPREQRGQWNVADSRCLSTPPDIPARGDTGTLSSTAPLEGYADIHVHQMADLGFGGTIVWGGALGDPATALAPIPKEYRRGHNSTETATHGKSTWSIIRRTVVNALIGDVFVHGEHGWPTFESWPDHDRWTHQQVYEDWLFRAYRGGLRLMVMLAANSEDAFGRGENHLPILRTHKFQKSMLPGRTGNDMEALERQISGAYLLQQRIDAACGTPGCGWYRIVRDPTEAGAVISEGKLAVVLGSEIQHLFNCDVDRPACTHETIVEGLNRLEGMGVSYVFPVHHKLNQFGGPATFQPLNSGPTVQCRDVGSPCSAIGLTTLGRFLMRELMARGMLIDVEHLSRFAFADAMAEVEAQRYPVLAGHVVPRDLQTKDSQQTERARTSEELARIAAVGGVMTPILSSSADEFNDAAGATTVPLPIRCDMGHNGGVDQWSNAFLLLRAINGRDAARPIPFGTDWNGFAGWPGPRHNAEKPCVPRKVRTGEPIQVEREVAYPIELPRELVPAKIGGTATLERFDWPARIRTWDYNRVGMAHVGLLPDFVENLRRLGFTLGDLEPLYRSARGVVQLWTTARDRELPIDYHSVRWVPQHPFDTMEFDSADASRDILAGDFPICRTRLGHALGFVRDDICQPIEPPRAVSTDAVPISGYHAGRCLDVREASFDDDASVEQMQCTTASSQQWYVRGRTANLYEVANANSGKCLTMAASNAKAPRLVQSRCDGSARQQWRTKRVGNTFHLIDQRGSCLGVRGQSLDDHARVEPQVCTGASNQLWTIGSLRDGDFERLYEAERGRTHWRPDASPDFPLPVTVDGVRWICQARRAGGSLGVVAGGRCVGRDVDGAPIDTPDFDVLYQGR